MTILYLYDNIKYMLWLKTFHIIFVISWFAGLFYLPRLFVNSAQFDSNSETYQHLLEMSQRLYRFMTFIMLLALLFGLALTAYQWPYYLLQPWLQIKLAFVGLLIAYHITCFYFLKQFNYHKNDKTHQFYRWFNEAPILLLFCIVSLVIFKPG